MRDESPARAWRAHGGFHSVLPARLVGGAGMLIIGWLIIIGIVFWVFHQWDERQTHPNRALIAAPGGELVLQRNREGHYLADGEVNGTRVTFLLDTGATRVALSSALARELGLKLGPPVTLSTAAGPAQGYSVRLRSVNLGGIEMRNVGALVSDGLEPGLVLLGMNFLKQLEMTQRGDQLVLKPRR